MRVASDFVDWNLGNIQGISKMIDRFGGSNDVETWKSWNLKKNDLGWVWFLFSTFGSNYQQSGVTSEVFGHRNLEIHGIVVNPILNQMFSGESRAFYLEMVDYVDSWAPHEFHGCRNFPSQNQTRCPRTDLGDSEPAAASFHDGCTGCFRAKKRRQNTQGISKQHVINLESNLLGSIRAEMWWLMTSNIWVCLKMLG